MADWYTFTCPECGAEFAVDATARGEVLDAGCVRCGTAVTLEAFSERSAPTAI